MFSDCAQTACQAPDPLLQEIINEELEWCMLVAYIIGLYVTVVRQVVTVQKFGIHFILLSVIIMWSYPLRASVLISKVHF